jgi:serine phosphatase RsbU (regulator of sigma subunit)
MVIGMLRFDDFFHLPQLDQLIEQVIATRQGVTVVAGFDPRPPAGAGGGPLPSGRTAVFRALVGALLDGGAPSAVVVADRRDAVRVPRRVKVLAAQAPHSYADQIAAAITRRPDLLIVDRLDEASAPAAFAAARVGVRVVAQIDTICRGAELTRHLHDLGVRPEDAARLAWVIGVQRMPRLCPHCARPEPPDPARLARLRDLPARAGTPPWRDHPNLAAVGFARAAGCEHCGQRGRLGDVAVFDIYQADPIDAAQGESGGTAQLPIEHYLWQLVEQGLLALDDLLEHETERIYRTYRLLSASGHSLAETNATLQRKLVELESANQVLQQRTAALGSLYDIGQALTGSTSLAELAARVCRHTRDLCGADRAILYLTRPGQPAEILAAIGWHPRQPRGPIDLDQLGLAGEPAMSPFVEWPPGIPAQHADLAGFAIRVGWRVPLVADGRAVGVMIAQSTRKARFAPSELALLRTLAGQAALAIQRAELIEARVQQERLEHELELARQVQQSVLPRVFPQVSGYTFAACNQPARQVGGDFYDVFALDEDRIGVVIADVSGKGMPAALYMALTRSLLLAEARREPSPRAALLSVNRLLREIGDPHMFVTVFYGVIALAERRLTYARAGHDYPLLLREGAISSLGGVGIVLGFFDSDEIRLSEEQLDLRADDRLVLYTDGLTDVLAPDGTRLEPARLREIVAAHAAEQPEALCQSTFADLAAFQSTAEQFDDMTLLVIGVGDAEP